MGAMIGMLFLLLLAVAYDSISEFVYWLPDLYWEPAALMFCAALLVAIYIWLPNTPKEVKNKQVWVFLISFLAIAAFILLGGIK